MAQSAPASRVAVNTLGRQPVARLPHPHRAEVAHAQPPFALAGEPRPRPRASSIQIASQRRSRSRAPARSPLRPLGGQRRWAGQRRIHRGVGRKRHTARRLRSPPKATNARRRATTRRPRLPRTRRRDSQRVRWPTREGAYPRAWPCRGRAARDSPQADPIATPITRIAQVVPATEVRGHPSTHPEATRQP